MSQNRIASFLRRNAVRLLALTALAAVAAYALHARYGRVPQLGPTPPVAEMPRGSPTHELDEAKALLARAARPWDVSYDLPADISKGARSVASQTVVVGDGTLRKQTGFLVRSGIILTAAHITEHDNDRQVMPVECGGVKTEARVLVNDHLRDIIVARADACMAKRTLKIDLTPYVREKPLWISGFTFDPEPHKAFRFFLLAAPLPSVAFQAGEDPVIRGRKETADQLGIPPVRALDALVIRGNSGSPVFADNGTVVGMVVLIDVEKRRSFMVPAVNLQHALNEAAIK